VESSGSVTAPQVRRLLRALGDPAALRRDALARRLVGDGRDDPVAQQERTQRLIAFLRASLSAMCTHAPTPKAAQRLRRAARIVERCDLDGDAHADAANDAGVARRQLYRDRAFAFESLAIELDDALRARSPQAARTVDAARLTFDAAETLVGVGRYADAERLLQRVCRNAAGDDRRRASARLLETAVDWGEPEALRRALKCSQLFAESDLIAHRRLELAVLCARAALGDAPEETAERTRILNALRVVGEASDERWEVLALGLSQHAAAAHKRGAFGAALAALHEAEFVLRRCAEPPLTLPALLPNLQGVVLMMLPQSLDAASAQHQRAVSLARPRGLLRIAIASTLNDFAIDLWKGRAAAICDAAIETLETARAISSADEFGRLAILVAQIAMGARRLEDAARLLDEVSDRADSPRLRPRAMLAKSEALLQAGEFERASDTARGALDATRRTGESALIGTALLLDAEALAARRRTPQARRTLARALAALRRNGSAHALHRAQALARHLQTA
jgi:hypothetical protein